MVFALTATGAQVTDDETIKREAGYLPRQRFEANYLRYKKSDIASVLQMSQIVLNIIHQYTFGRLELQDVLDAISKYEIIPEDQLNCVNFRNNSSLMLLCTKGKDQLVKHLFELNKKSGGLDFGIRNQYGEYAYKLARDKNQNGVLKIYNDYSNEYALVIKNSFNDLALPLAHIVASFYFGNDPYFERETV